MTNSGARCRAARWGLIAVLFVPTSAFAITGSSGLTVPPNGVIPIGTLPSACGRSFAPSCSGVLIRPTLLLTAAHCLAHWQAMEPLAVQDANNGRAVDIAAVHLHDQYGQAGGFDIALAELAAPLSMVPVQLPPVDTLPLSSGSNVEIWGFGGTSSGAAPTGLIKGGVAKVSSDEADTIAFAPAPNLVCNGDSGGPVFLRNGEDILLRGIVTKGDPPCLSWGLAVSLIGTAREWIDRSVAQIDATVMAPLILSPAFDESTAYKEMCSRPCTAETDCPQGTRCRTIGEPAVRRCVASGLLPGSIVGACTSQTSHCDACIQLAKQTSACACYRTCPGFGLPLADAGAPISDGHSSASTGCTIGGEYGYGSTVFLAWVVALVLGRRHLRAIFPHRG